QWKWQLVRILYEKGFSKFDILNLLKFIDKMMTLPPALQSSFQNKVNQYEEEQRMEFLSTIEEMAIEKTAKETYRENILDLLEKRFNSLPESLVKAVNQIDDLALLKQLHLETITVSSVSEFEDLIKDDSLPEN
ncbi:MAG: transposase, partial [Trichodesmium sp.]